MSLTPRGFEDIALDNMKTILSAYVTAQKTAYATANPGATQAQINAAVGFTVERDVMTPDHEEDLKAQASVVLGFDSETPGANYGKERKKATATLFADCIAAKGETLDGLAVAGDKGANARLLYLKAQVEAALYDLAEYDLGFTPGTVLAKKPFASWQTTSSVQEGGEAWVVSGRWTFSFDYEWAPESPQGVTLAEISVNATLWAGLYEYPPT
jgi:hypothetical protein